jgi:uncharacterized protein YigA (DUF484 family)
VTSPAGQPLQGITENDIANYLANTPGFFERHSELLAAVQLTSPHGQRAVSLQERQMEMMRERVKGLEQKLMEMIRHGQENLGIADRLHAFTRQVLLAGDAALLPAIMQDSLRHEFLIPQTALRLWGVADRHLQSDFAQPVSSDVRSFVASLTAPYCGINAGFEATRWLAEPGSVMSLAMIPLVHDDTPFGLLVLASPDPTRYSASMGTEFLQRIGEIAAAALWRLRERQ